MKNDDINPVPESPDDFVPDAYVTSDDIQPVAQTVSKARRFQGYNLFLRGFTQRDIASKLGVSPAMVCKWAKADNWVERKRGVSLKAEDLLDQVISTEIADAVKFMRGKINQRLVELDMACQRGSVQAIIAWLNRAGLPTKNEEPKDQTPKDIAVVDDISIKKPV